MIYKKTKFGRCEYCNKKFTYQKKRGWIIRYKVKDLIVCCNCYNNYRRHGKLKKVMIYKKYKTNKERIEARNKKARERQISFSIAGRKVTVYTNGVTEEMKKIFPDIKNKVFEDCIKNPQKYLKNGKENSRDNK